MGSRIVCACGATLHKNLFSGNNVQLLVSEGTLDRDLRGVSAEDLVAQILSAASVTISCGSCKRLHVLDDSGARLPLAYALEVQSDTKY